MWILDTDMIWYPSPMVYVGIHMTWTQVDANIGRDAADGWLCIWYQICMETTWPDGGIPYWYEPRYRHPVLSSGQQLIPLQASTDRTASLWARRRVTLGKADHNGHLTDLKHVGYGSPGMFLPLETERFRNVNKITVIIELLSWFLCINFFSSSVSFQSELFCANRSSDQASESSGISHI